MASLGHNELLLLGNTLLTWGSVCVCAIHFAIFHDMRVVFFWLGNNLKHSQGGALAIKAISPKLILTSTWVPRNLDRPEHTFQIPSRFHNTHRARQHLYHALCKPPTRQDDIFASAVFYPISCLFEPRSNRLAMICNICITLPLNKSWSWQQGKERTSFRFFVQLPFPPRTDRLFLTKVHQSDTHS